VHVETPQKCFSSLYFFPHSGRATSAGIDCLFMPLPSGQFDPAPGPRRVARKPSFPLSLRCQRLAGLSCFSSSYKNTGNFTARFDAVPARKLRTATSTRCRTAAPAPNRYHRVCRGTAPKFCMFYKRGLLLLHPVEHTKLRSCTSVVYYALLVYVPYSSVKYFFLFYLFACLKASTMLLDIRGGFNNMDHSTVL